MSHSAPLYHPVQVVGKFTPEVNALTHTSPHHADEAFATAMLSFLRPMTVFCTRDAELLQSFDGFVYDVGGEYNHTRLRYDHHQRDFTETHPDGHKLAAAGLIWRHYGAQVVSKFSTCPPDLVSDVVDFVDRELISGLDANDNGQVEDGAVISLASTLGLFNLNWNEHSDHNAAFAESVALAQRILERAVVGAIAYVVGRQYVDAAIAESDGQYFVLSKRLNIWVQAAVESTLPQAKSLLYGVTQDTITNTWRVRALPPDMQHQMDQRKKLPAAWCGLSGDALVRVTGVATAQFCHASGFLAVAGTREDAIKLAELAVAAPSEKS